jgi:N utilization substance protein A
MEVEIDSVTGATNIFKTEDDKKVDITPPGFGRIAAQTAKQVILQRVREAEKDAIISEYTDKVGTILSGMVLRFDGKNVIVDIGRGQGFMPPEEQMRGEFYRMNQRLTIYIRDIRETMRGKTIIVSRAAEELVAELFRREVPEVASESVVIKAIAREAGIRTKIAVDSTQPGVDPVGSCVGQKGVRVQEVINELNNEKIDIIQYTSDPKAFITAALAPAENIQIELDEENKVATISVPDDQLSLAIGKGGQNVRLAGKLTGYKLDIVGSTGEKVEIADDAAENNNTTDAE